MYKPFDLTGKVVAIVGGNKGIGKGIAQALVDAGATVVIGGRTVEKNIAVAQEIGCDHDVIDATEECSVREFFDGIVAKYNRLDACFAVVGGPTRSPAPFDLTPIDYWESEIKNNLTSVYLCYREAGRNMIKLGNGGSLVSVSSICSISASAYVSGYATAKAGLVGMTNSLCKKFGEYGIRINTIMAGIIETEMISDIMPDDFKESMRKKSVFNRIGKVEDFGGLSVYLTSDSSSWHTADTFLLDGGTTKNIS